MYNYLRLKPGNISPRAHCRVRTHRPPPPRTARAVARLQWGVVPEMVDDLRFQCAGKIQRMYLCRGYSKIYFIPSNRSYLRILLAWYLPTAARTWRYLTCKYSRGPNLQTSYPQYTPVLSKVTIPPPSTNHCPPSLQPNTLSLPPFTSNPRDLTALPLLLPLHLFVVPSRFFFSFAVESQ